MVGKLFPTVDPDHPAPLKTANFMTQEDIGGSRTEFFNDVELRNAPDTTVTRRGAGIPMLMLVGIVVQSRGSETLHSTAVPDCRARQTSR